MAAKKISAMDFIVAALKKNKKVSYADIKKAADKKKLSVYPIMYGRAKLLLGLVKAGKKKKKKAKAAKRPGRPRKAGRRGPGRPKKTARRGRPRKAADPADAIRSLIANMKDTERENARLRTTLAKVADMIEKAL